MANLECELTWIVTNHPGISIGALSGFLNKDRVLFFTCATPTLPV